MQLDEKNKKKIFGILRVLFPKAKFYLFGSRSRGTAHKFSDIDIAIDEGQEIESRRLGEAKAMFAESDIVLNIDLVDMHSVPQILLEQIKKEGTLWEA